MITQTQKKQPDYAAFTVRNYGEDKSSWTRIGAAWNNSDGEGINIVLDSLPIDGKITLRVPKEEDQEQQAA